MSKNNKVSGCTHTRQQLNHYSNQKNPNNHQHKAKNNNHSNQCNPNNKIYVRNLLSKQEFQYESCQPDD